MASLWLQVLSGNVGSHPCLCSGGSTYMSVHLHVCLPHGEIQIPAMVYFYVHVCSPYVAHADAFMHVCPRTRLCPRVVCSPPSSYCVCPHVHMYPVPLCLCPRSCKPEHTRALTSLPPWVSPTGAWVTHVCAPPVLRQASVFTQVLTVPAKSFG